MLLFMMNFCRWYVVWRSYMYFLVETVYLANLVAYCSMIMMPGFIAVRYAPFVFVCTDFVSSCDSHF